MNRKIRPASTFETLFSSWTVLNSWTVPRLTIGSLNMLILVSIFDRRTGESLKSIHCEVAGRGEYALFGSYTVIKSPCAFSPKGELRPTACIASSLVGSVFVERRKLLYLQSSAVASFAPSART